MMTEVRILAFDVNSSLAQFRKNYTTTSTLTFSIPPPSSLRGLVGSILGLRYDEIQDKLETAQFGVQILSEIKKTRIMKNLINTKLDIAPLGIAGPPRIQVRSEYIHEPQYRVYFSSPDAEIIDGLKDRLIQHKSYFTPYLGKAYCIANFQWMNECHAHPKTVSGETTVLTAIPKSWVKRMSLQKGNRYMVERLPSLIDQHRTPKGYIDLIFDAGGAPIIGEFSHPLCDIGEGKHIALI
ncbi:MAG: type I-B CRISPR-associated protein Cas5b [Candidatus Thorarchaeota archaeon]|nr:type I-B CRISPR-associated protein Cas5b [Candidatus Thorarchaeota archaeon]